VGATTGRASLIADTLSVWRVSAMAAMDWGLAIGVVGVIGVPVAIGLTMAATTPGEFRFVRGCFIVAAVLAIVSFLALTHDLPLNLAKIISAGVVGASVLIGLVFALEWVDKKQASQPSRPETAVELPDVTLRFVFREEPALMLVNQSNVVAKSIKWTVVLWNLDDPKAYRNPKDPIPDLHEPLQIPVATFDFLRPNTSSIQNLFGSPLVSPHVKKGDRLVGSASAVCPDCARGHTIVAYIVLGQGGWYAEILNDTSGSVIIPRRLTRGLVLEYYNKIMSEIPEKDRITITDPF
jgi:hypothetical protein